MIVEMAVLNVRPGQETAFEAVMSEALPLITATEGFIDLEVRPCVEARSRYLLLVRWRALEDHTVGFRASDRYEQWHALLHHFYDPFPTVEHFAEPAVSAP